MVKFQNFNEALERDLTMLTADIREQQKQREGGSQSKRELVRSSLERFAERVAPSVPADAAHASPPVPSEAQHGGPMPAYLQGDGADKEAQREVSALLNALFAHGMASALREAKRHSPFVIDAFHDALTDHLLPELEKRGIV